MEGTCTFDQEAIQLILAYSQCRPFDIQRLCHQVTSQVLAQGDRVVTAEDVRHVYASRFFVQRDLVEHVTTELDSVLSWAADHPDADPSHLRQQLRGFMYELEQVLIEQVGRLRQDAGAEP
jgi:hypothetical protein